MSTQFSSGLELRLGAQPPKDTAVALTEVYDAIRLLASVLGTVHEVTAATTLDDTYFIVLVSGGVTITLPAADSVPRYKRYTIKNTDSASSSTIATDGTELIDGAPYAILTYRQTVTVVTDGTGWWVI